MRRILIDNARRKKITGAINNAWTFRKWTWPPQQMTTSFSPTTRLKALVTEDKGYS